MLTFLLYCLLFNTSLILLFTSLLIMCSDLRHTHELKLHQLLVRVVGWEQVKPVSVDKVGVFFRYAAPDRNNPSSTVSVNGSNSL